VVVDECAAVTDHVPDLTLLGLRSVHRRRTARRDERAARRAARPS
jgi:type III pantothenate kinase